MSDNIKTLPNSPLPNSEQTASQLTLFAEGSLARTSPSQGGGAGMGEGTRSGLWSEYARLIGELRPRYAIVENVSALLSRGLDRVLGDLAALGYDAEWHCIPASAVGAAQERERLWIIADSGQRKMRANWLCGLPQVSRDDWQRLVHPGGNRGDYEIPNWVDRVGALGNAVVPQIPELIGRAILSAEAASPEEKV